MLLLAVALAALCCETNAVSPAAFAGADNSLLQTKQTTGKKFLGSIGAAIGGAVSAVGKAVGGAIKSLFGGKKEAAERTGVERPGIFEEDIKDPYGTL